MWGADIAAAESGGLYAIDSRRRRVVRILPGGQVTPFSGAVAESTGGNCDGPIDGRAESAIFALPTGICTDGKGTVYVTDTANQRIRQIAPDGAVTTVAGSGPLKGLNGELGFDMGGLVDGPALEARFSMPEAIAIAKDGSLYIGDSGNIRIRKLSKDGQVSSIYQTVSNQEQPRVSGIAVHPNGTVYFTEGSALRSLLPSGQLKTLIEEDLTRPTRWWQGFTGVAIAPNGTIYVADLFRVNTLDVTTSKLTPVAGHLPDCPEGIAASP